MKRFFGGRRNVGDVICLLVGITLVLQITGLVIRDAAASEPAYTVEEITSETPADGGSLALTSVADFSPEGGVAVLEAGTSSEERISYTGVYVDANELVGVTRGSSIAHPAGAPIMAYAPDPVPSPTPTTSPATDETSSGEPTDSQSAIASEGDAAPSDDSNSPSPQGSTSSEAGGNDSSVSSVGPWCDDELLRTADLCGIPSFEQEEEGLIAPLTLLDNGVLELTGLEDACSALGNCSEPTCNGRRHRAGFKDTRWDTWIFWVQVRVVWCWDNGHIYWYQTSSDKYVSPNWYSYVRVGYGEWKTNGPVCEGGSCKAVSGVKTWCLYKRTNEFWDKSEPLVGVTGKVGGGSSSIGTFVGNSTRCPSALPS